MDTCPAIFLAAVAFASVHAFCFRMLSSMYVTNALRIQKKNLL